MKICTKCKLEKEKSEFYIRKRSKDGLCSFCKFCSGELQKSDKAKAYQKKYKQSSKYVAYRKEYQQSGENKEYQKEYRQNNDNKEYQKEYRQNNDNKEYQKEYQKKYQRSDDYKKSQKRYRRKCYNNRYYSDIQFRLSVILRGRLRKVLNGTLKSGSAVRDLGCTIIELKVYLEKQFEVGMSWENWGRGKGKWHIDHIYPLSKVDLTDREQLLKVCHYTNLQPLWAEENIRKGNKILDF